MLKKGKRRLAQSVDDQNVALQNIRDAMRFFSEDHFVQVVFFWCLIELISAGLSIDFSLFSC